jgi:hypothetical protein
VTAPFPFPQAKEIEALLRKADVMGGGRKSEGAMGLGGDHGVKIDYQHAQAGAQAGREQALAAAISRRAGAAVESEDVEALVSVQAAIKSHYTGRTMTHSEAFAEIDADRSGYLDREEVRSAMGLLGLGGLSTDDVERVMKLMDPDGDGKVTKAEFEEWWKDAIDPDDDE